MSRIVYVNGEYVPEETARVSVFDRGFLFADGVYEVTLVLDGALVDNSAHLVRLRRSLRELAIEAPADDADITAIQRELIARNALVEGVVYLQITRGAADRSFAFPDSSPTLVMFTQALTIIDNPAVRRGLAVITLPDLRWARRDIKTTSLLAGSMAKQAALEAGADDAWLVEDGTITEGTSNNAWIVTRDGALVTRQLGEDILHGITRAAVLRCARDEGLRIEERAFSVSEAQAASEAFSTSASTLVMPVVRIDGHDIGNGRPGRTTLALRERYLRAAASGELG